MTNGKWTYDLENSETWRCEDEFDTKEEAIEYAKSILDEDRKLPEDEQEFEGTIDFEVGQIKSFIPFIHACQIIDIIQEDAYDQCCEAAEDYLDNISKEDKEKLQDMLNETLNQWLTETNNHPKFGSMKNTKTIEY